MTARKLVALAVLLAVLTLCPGPGAWGAEQERAVVFLPETANVSSGKICAWAKWLNLRVPLNWWQEAG